LRPKALGRRPFLRLVTGIDKRYLELLVESNSRAPWGLRRNSYPGNPSLLSLVRFLSALRHRTKRPQDFSPAPPQNDFAIKRTSSFSLKIPLFKLETTQHHLVTSTHPPPRKYLQESSFFELRRASLLIQIKRRSPVFWRRYRRLEMHTAILTFKRYPEISNNWSNPATPTHFIPR